MPDLDVFSKPRMKKFLSLAILFSGLLVLSFSSYVYESPKTAIMQLDSPENITNDEGANFSFKVSRPSKIDQISLGLLMNSSEGPPLSVSVNGQKVAEVSGLYQEIDLQSGEFEKQNTVVLERTEIGFVDQSLIDAEVKIKDRSYSNEFLTTIIFSFLLIIAPIIYWITKS